MFAPQQRMMWGLFALAEQEDIWKKLHAEVVAVPILLSHKLSPDELNTLPYLDAVVCKTSRSNTAAPTSTCIVTRNDKILRTTTYPVRTSACTVRLNMI